MKIKNIFTVLVCSIVVFGTLIFTFPGLNILGSLGVSFQSYSYSAPAYKVDVKDVKNKKDIKFVYNEIDQSKVIGTFYPDDRERITQEGSFFIAKSSGTKYKTVTSICWYGEKSNVCLVQNNVNGESKYIEMTPALQKFFNTKMTGSK